MIILSYPELITIKQEWNRRLNHHPYDHPQKDREINLNLMIDDSLLYFSWGLPPLFVIVN